MEDKKDNSKFVEREWNEEIEGELDQDGFFTTPNGSFWDPDYVYFNRDGFDKHGGRYEKGVYIPGKGWDSQNNCYESEKEEDFDEYDDEDIEKYKKDNKYIDFDNFDDLDDDIFEADIIGKNDKNINEIIEESIQNDKIKKDKKIENKEKEKEKEKENG